MGEFAVRPVDGSPRLGDLQDGVDLGGYQGVQGDPASRQVIERAELAASLPPAMHPVIGHLPQRAHPAVREAGRDRFVDGLQHQLFHVGGDPRRERSGQSQPDFPRTTASSIACALIASVSWPISDRAASSSQFRSTG